MGRSAFLVVTALIGWALLTPVVSARALFFSNDGPQHLYAAIARLHPTDARSFGAFVQAHTPVSSRGFVELFSLLEPRLGWEYAYRGTLWLLASAWAWAAFAFLRRAQPRAPAIAPLAFPLALQHALYAGFFPYVCASAIGLGACAVLLHTRARWAGVAAGAALLWVAAVSHVVAAGCCGVLAAALVLTEDGVRLRQRIAAVALMAVPAASVALRTWGERFAAGSREEDSGFGARLFLIAEGFQVGGFVRPLTFLALVVVGAALTARAARTLTARQRALALLALGAFALVVAFGAHWGSWDYGGLRVLPVGALALLAALPLDVMPVRWRRVFGAVCGVYIAASAVWAVQWTRAADRRWGDLLDTVRAIPARPMTWFPVIAASPDTLRDLRPYSVVPEARVGQLLALGAGGLVADSHDSDPILHHVLRRPGVLHVPEDPRLPGSPALLAAARADQLAYLPRVASLAAPYDGVLLFARPDPQDFIAPLRERGWALLWQQGDVALLGLEGCSVRIRFEGARAPVAWRFGVWPVKTAHAVGVVEPGADVILTRQPCGESWVRPRDGACRSADATTSSVSGYARGLLRPEVTHEIVCVLAD